MRTRDPGIGNTEVTGKRLYAEERYGGGPAVRPRRIHRGRVKLGEAQ
jgi:hypothetical protein